MFDSLLESRAKKPSRLGGSIVSAVGHALLVAGVVAVTANAHVAPEAEPEPNVTFTPVVPPPPPPPLERIMRDPVVVPPLAKGPPVLTVPVDIPDVIPPINLNVPPTNERDWLVPGKRGGSPEGVASGVTSDVVIAPGDFWTRETVDRVVVMLPGGAAPRYPESLRAAGVEGEVTAQFVVDTLGRADVTTLRILQSDHALFDDAIRSALPRLRFVPAEARGHKVRQLVQQPFRFGLDRE
jgi:protein TonB